MNLTNIVLVFFNFLLLFAKLFVCGQEASGTSRNNSHVSFEEYRDFLPPDIFAEFVRIHTDDSLLLIDKLKQLNTLFIELPARTLAQIPLPRAFRRLPLSAQTTVRRIYYSKWMTFEEKLTRLDAVIHNLQNNKTPVTRQTPLPMDAEIFAAPDGKHLPLFVEFDVPVLLHFNGKIETNQLQRYLSPDEFDLLTRIIGEVSGDAMGRSRLVGRLLKEAYAQHGGSYFPSLQMMTQFRNGDNDGLSSALTPSAEDITQLGVHLMFGRNDYDSIDAVASSYQLIKSGAIDYKSFDYGFRDNENEYDYTDLPDLPNIDRFYRRRNSQRKEATGIDRADDFSRRENFSFRQKTTRTPKYHEIPNDEFASQKQQQRHQQQNENGRENQNRDFHQLRDFVAGFVGNIHI